MGIFLNAIEHQIVQFETKLGKKPKFLMLDYDKKTLLLYELGNLSFEEQGSKYYKEFDSEIKKTRHYFMGLKIVEIGIQFGGSMSWGIGE